MAGNTPLDDEGLDHVGDWMFTAIPLGVAFAFYVVFISVMNFEHTELFIAFGAAAAFIGLETYWIVRGLFTQNYGPVFMGFFGIAATLGILYMYLSFIGYDVQQLIEQIPLK